MLISELGIESIWDGILEYGKIMPKIFAPFKENNGPPYIICIKLLFCNEPILVTNVKDSHFFSSFIFSSSFKYLEEL